MTPHVPPRPPKALAGQVPPPTCPKGRSRPSEMRPETRRRPGEARAGPSAAIQQHLGVGAKHTGNGEQNGPEKRLQAALHL